jgi:hypothetical protein
MVVKHIYGLIIKSAENNAGLLPNQVNIVKDAKIMASALKQIVTIFLPKSIVLNAKQKGKKLLTNLILIPSD